MPSCTQTFNQAKLAANSPSNSGPPFRITGFWLRSIGYKSLVLRWQFIQALFESIVEIIHDSFLASIQFIILLSSIIQLFSGNQPQKKMFAEIITSLIINIKIFLQCTVGIIYPSFYADETMQHAVVSVRNRG